MSEKAPPDASPHSLEPAETAPGVPSLAGVRVLVVDDELDAREMIRVALEKRAAKVMTADSAQQALTLLSQNMPDVLISDIGMPEKDGYALMQQVRALSPERGGAVPAIALTAYARGQDRERALAVGFQRHVAKPVNPAELAQIVAALADGRG